MLAETALPADSDEDPWEAAVPGRLIVSIIEGHSIYRPGKRGTPARIDPYVRMEIGRGSGNALRHKTSVVKNQSDEPNFKGESVFLDLADPRALAVADNLVFNYEVWTSNTFADELLGEGSVSLLPFFKYRGERPVRHRMPLAFQAKGRVGEPAIPAGDVVMEFRFEAAARGTLVITCKEGINLRNMDSFGQQDPYVQVTLGRQRKRTRTIQKGGINPFFNDEEIELFVDGQNWAEPLDFELFDEDVGRDDFIGGARVSVLRFIQDFAATDKVISLSTGPAGSGDPAGEVRLGFKFFPAGKLTVQVAEGRGLASADQVGQQDPYVVLSLAGSAQSLQFTSRVDTDGGNDPVWNETAVFDVVDHHEMKIEVFDKDLLGTDDLIGATTMSLLPVFKHGIRDGWITLKRRTTWGKVEERGEIRLAIDFTAPPRIAYPQRQPDLDAFDETERRGRDGSIGGRRPGDKRGASAAAADAASASASSTARRAEDGAGGAEGEAAKGEFTDQEVEEAFNFIDLDRNLFIGAAELRHVLICMGEIITDEEIDEMIRMVDRDGDGQVSFDEFYRLAKHPDPAAPDFQIRAIDGAVASVAGGAATPGKPGGRRRGSDMSDDSEPRDDSGGSPAKGGRGRAPPPPPLAPPPGASPSRSPGGATDDDDSLTLRGGGTTRRTDDPAVRAREAQVKEERKRLLKRFVDDNTLRLPDLQRAYQRFKTMENARSGLIGFKELCEIFGAEPTGEARQMYNVFVDPEQGRVLIKSFLLALNNFTGADRNQRVNFCFWLFDEDNSGTLDTEEIVRILQANHLASDPALVQRKAETIMKQADKDGSGSVDMEEFLIIAHKFPNLLFPNFS